MRRHRFAPALAPLAIAFLLPSAAFAQADDEEWLRNCRDDDNERARHCEVRVARRAAGGTLRVNAAPNGGIRIQPWDGDGVEVHARIGVRADSDSEARALAERIRVETDGETIRATGPESNRDGSWYVSYLVLVPARSDLELRSLNGPVSVEGITGRVDAETVNGPLTLRDVGGAVHARTRNGPLNVSLGGDRWQGEGLDAETSNGPIRLNLPEGYSARLVTGTRNGPMTTEVPLTVTMLGRRSSQIETTLGDGGPEIRVVTTNGPVSIRRR